MQQNVIMNDEEMEIDLRELFMVLIGHWVLILCSTIVFGVAALLVSMFLMTPQYESTSELYVLSKSTSITSITDIQLGSNLTNDYKVVVQGRPVLEQVIKNLGLQTTYRSLNGKISLNNPKDSRILQITVTDTDPRMAKKIADEIATVSAAFISQKMDQDPPSIIQYGYADGEKVSPSISKNSMVGALLGFLLACAIVTIKYLFDDSIMDAEDVEKKLGMNLLGTLPYVEEANLDDKGSHMGKKSGKSA